MINIALSFDQNYLRQFYTLITSIFYNNRTTQINFYCIASGILVEDEQRIADFVRGKCGTITFLSFDERQLNSLKGTLSGTWSLAVYYKLFLPLLAPDNVNRILYLDTDTLVVGNIDQLFYHPLDGFPIGAVYDNYVKCQPLIGIDGEGNYFNSGMMLIDVGKWRDQQITEKCISFLQAHSSKVRYVDQDALNAVLRNNWNALNPRFNLIHSYIPFEATKSEWRRFSSSVVVVHFTMYRPWLTLCKNRFRKEYIDYFKKSPLRKENAIVDFSIDKVIPLLKLRMIELYLNYASLRTFWRKAKALRMNWTFSK